MVIQKLQYTNYIYAASGSIKTSLGYAI